MASLLKAWFHHRLKELGYEITTSGRVYWSLGWCQGDGMAFEERCLDVDRLSERWADGDASARDSIRHAFEVDGVSLSIRHEGRYTHWNSMDIELDEGDLHGEDDLSAHERLARTRRIADVDAFHAWVEQDVKATSRLLEREGYAILEAAWPKDASGLAASSERGVVASVAVQSAAELAAARTLLAEALRKKSVVRGGTVFEGFLIELSETEDREYPDVPDEDEESLVELARGCVAKEIRYAGLEARIIDLDTDDVVAEQFSSIFVGTKDEESYAQLALDLVDEAAREAQNLLPAPAEAEAAVGG